MMRRLTALWIVGLIGTLVLALLVTVSCGDDDDTGATVGKIGALEVTDAGARAVLNGGAAYFTVKNTGDTDDALVDASSDVARKVELHEVVTVEGMHKMQPVAEIAIPAKGEAILQPGGYHVMLLDLEETLEVGDTITLTLTFKEAGSLDIQAGVVPYAE